jgi:hypothetical protein
MKNNLKTWVAHVRPHGSSAKTKGLIQPGPASQREEREHGWITSPILTGDKETVYKELCKFFWPNDTRPLQGKSYLKPFNPKVGKKVYIVPGWRIGYNEDGTEIRTHIGVVSEVLCGRTVSIAPEGYENKFVDFSAREVVLF